jgi:prolipoprotein diacylglyceryltransferase
VPAELTDPTRPLPNGMPRLLLKNDIDGRIHQLERLNDPQKAKNPGWAAELERLKTLQGRYPTLTADLHAKPVHPTEIYSAFNAFLIAAVCLAYFSLRPSPGRVFALMLILKGMSRFTLEMIRVEPPVLGNMSFSMVVSVGLLIVGVVMWLACGWRDRGTGAGRIYDPLPAV